ncbi:hypothetical protein AMEX_G10096 [Astyanax mexicanus]|uniref:BTB domain-containing protein n=1 Tax=Astyanax mexicanus TaxID=7994 RepID=A0A8T2LXP9_ASTMX|nr:hypothetical protein AMEX_G10096 [Astyanax mexicanus]
MWTYRQPAFALQLLHELQKQQQGGLHCDTLLQTEGVSVPAHSCVLSALSPVFSRALTKSPPLAVGHSRVLSVQAVGTRSLLKLVGFVYSGEMEGEGIVELEEVTDTARRLGFSSLIDGLKELMKGQKDKAMRKREIGMQTENAEERKRDASVQIQSDRRSLIYSESQTDSPEAHFTDICTAPRSVGLSGELSSVPSDENASTSAPGVNCMKDTTASSSLSEAAVLLNSKCCQPIQRENKTGNVSEKTDQLKTVHHRSKLNVKGVQPELNSSVLKSIKKAGGKDFRKLVQKLHTTTFKQQVDAHISLKIKLKRRRGTLWEIISVQEESAADGSSASVTCPASPRKTRSYTKNGATCSQPQMNGPGVPQSPSPPNPPQPLGTVTLTPPSDLTLSPPHTPVRNPPSSPLQIAPLSPGVPPAEESDEHIARLMEDMVMMGLNILPSGPMDRKSDMHHLCDKCAPSKLHLDLKVGQGESLGTDAVPCLCVDGGDLGADGPDVVKIPPSLGCSAQGEAGSECPGSKNQFRCETVDLRNVTSEASHPTSFAVTKDADASLMSSLPFSTGGLELPQENVVELKNALDHLLWTANDCVHSAKQTRTNETTEEENMQSSGTDTRSATHSDLARLNAVVQTTSGSINSAAVKQQSEGASLRDSKRLTKDSSNVIHQELVKQISGSIHGSSSIADNNGIDLSEMRLPRCLSPLASEDVVTDGDRQKHTKLACTVLLRPVSMHLISSPQTETLPDKTGHQNPLTPPCIKPKTASVSGRSTRSLRSCQGCIKDTNDRRLEQVITPSLNKSRSTKRSSIDASLDEPNKKKRMMLDCNSSGDNTKSVKVVTECSTSRESVVGIKSTKCSDYSCTEKTYWLRPGKTVRRDQTDQQSKKKVTNLQTNQSCKSKDQVECTEAVGKKDSVMVKRGHRRHPKKEKDPVELQDNTSVHQDSQTTGSQVNQKHKEKEAPKAKILSKAISDVNLKKKEQKKSTRHASHTKRKGIVDQVFHQTIFTVGSTIAGSLPSIDQKLQSRPMNAEIAQIAERKRGIGPPLPHIVKKFRTLIDQDHIRGRKLVISEKEVNDSTEKGKIEKMINKGKMDMDQSENDKNVESENNSEQLTTTKKGKGCLVDENFGKEIDKNLIDTVSESINSLNGSCSVDLRTVDVNCNLDSDLPTVLLAGNFDINSSKTDDLHSETAKKCLEDTERTSDQTDDIPLKKDAQNHQDFNQDCKKQQVESNEEMGALVKEIRIQNEEHEAEGSDVDIEVMEESALVAAAGHGDEAATSACYGGKTEIELEKSQSSVGKSNGESVSHEAALRGPLLIRTEVLHISSDEDYSTLMHTGLPAITANKEEKSYLSMDSSTLAVKHGCNIETEGQKCGDDDDDDEEEEVVVDDLSSSPPVILANSLTNQESMTVLTDEELKSEEEEDVDVTG